MNSRHLYSLLLSTLLAGALHAQPVRSLPASVFSRDAGSVRTTLYVPGSQQLMVFQQNKCWLVTTDGKIVRGPVVIREDGGDLWYPRVSPSGKKIAFYLPGENIFDANDRMAVYDLDSGYILGTYKTPVLGEMERIQFFGDSILQYYISDTRYKLVYSWQTASGKVRQQSLEEDSLHHGFYDISLYKDRVLAIIRYGDSLSLLTTYGDKRQFFDMFKLKSASVKNWAQLSPGYPYALVGDESTGSTRIFKNLDTGFQLSATLPLLPEIYAVAGTEETCYLLYRDTTQKNKAGPVLFDSRSGRKISLALPPDGADIIYSIYPEQGIFTASETGNGTITAYHLADGSIAWTSSPHPGETNRAAPNATISSDNKLFKVLIKQGSENVNKSYYNSETNQLYLVKNNEQLVTVDADAKCAVRWEQFYKDDQRVTDVRLLPGNRYILYTEERWQKKTGGDDVDMDRNNHQYPYACKVFDRQTARLIFNLQSQSGSQVRILNDSLLYWSEGNYLLPTDSITLYNLNTGIAKKIRPLPSAVITDYTFTFINGTFYYFIATEDKKLVLLSETQKKIFSRSYPREDNFLSKVAFVENSPYFYFKDPSKNAVNQLYKIAGDSVKMIRNFPLGVNVLSAKATATGCYFMYEKEPGGKFQYGFINMINGRDKVIYSNDYVNDKAHSSFELFPEKNYLVENHDNVISWQDMENGYEFRNFGRNEPTIVSISYSPDGRYLAAGNPDGKVMLWDLGTGKETKTLSVGRNGLITKLAFSGDGQYLAASSGDIWETATGKNIVSVSDGSIWAVNSIDFSVDGKRIISGGACIISWDAADGSKLVFQQRPGAEDMDSSGTCWNPNGCISPDYGFMVHSTAFHPNSRDFVTGNRSGIVQKWNTESRRQLAYVFLGKIGGPGDIKVYDLKYTRDGEHIIAVQQRCIYRLNAGTLQVEDSLLLPESDEVLGIDMGYDGQVFGCITRRENARIVQVRRISDLTVQQEFYTEGASFNTISFSPNKKQVATASEDGFCTIWDLTSGKPAMYLSAMGDYGNIMVTPDNYYMASKSALDGVTFFKDSSFYSFDQFDLYLNRPDIVLERLGYASPELLNFYRNAHYKRLKKATGTTTDTGMDQYVPSLKLTNKKTIPVVTAAKMAALHFEIADSSVQKGSLRIFINGNLVKEHSFTETSKELIYADSVLLGQGVNNIEAVYKTSSAVSSRKEKIAITYSPVKKVQPKVWFIGVGLSQYRDKDMNLKYPVKDIRDLARTFKKRYPAILIDTLLNEKATKENIIALHDRLMKTGVDDKVIVSFNGHGLLSDSLDWYFATWDIDFKKPEDRGLSYSTMESILAGIPARQKLLLMDACHSGEVDKESDITFANKETVMEANVVTTARGFKKSESKVGLQTSFELMQDMFANLNNGNGTTVLSAAGGKEYALESDQWKNGVFTYSLLNALKDPGTDENGDKKISVKELKTAVFDAVKKLTGGRQKPTSRVEILDDWNIW